MCQAGFRKGRSCMDHVAWLSEQVKKAPTVGRTTVATFFFFFFFFFQRKTGLRHCLACQAPGQNAGPGYHWPSVSVCAGVLGLQADGGKNWSRQARLTPWIWESPRAVCLRPLCSASCYITSRGSSVHSSACPCMPTNWQFGRLCVLQRNEGAAHWQISKSAMTGSRHT